MKCRPEGRPDSRIMIVGEAPGQREHTLGMPFQGSAGQELNKMLSEAGIARGDCFLTNVARYRPKNNDIKNFYVKNTTKYRIPGEKIIEGIRELAQEIARVKPNVIIAVGDTALWSLTGNRGIKKWRGSLLQTKCIHKDYGVPEGYKVIPTYHPTAVLRVWEWRHVVVQDFRRVKDHMDSPKLIKPAWNFHIAPTFKEAFTWLNALLIRLEKATTPILIASDLETMAGHISCHGLAISKQEAMCIPLVLRERPEGYYTMDEEFILVQLMRRILTHPMANIAGQNYTYDAQYIVARWLCFPKLGVDTQIAWHTMFPGIPKSLDFIASMVCEYYQYWKDDLKDYNDYPDDPELYWTYNCQDAVYTYEIAEQVPTMLERLGLIEPYKFLMDLYKPTVTMDLRGVNYNINRKEAMKLEVQKAIQSRQNFFDYIIPTDKVKGRVNWWDSPIQQRGIFYEEFKLPIQKNKKTKAISCDDAALEVLKTKEPILKPVFTALQEYRSLCVFLNTFLEARIDFDNRIRCSFSLIPETYRYSCSKSVWGTGANLQTISKGNELDE